MGHILLAARAKVNLTLDILGRRPDGYHEIESLMQSVDLADIVRVSDGGPGIEIWSDSPDVPADSTNLAAKAALALATSCGARLGARGARIQIHKRIPVAAGLAGGSADAAATLLGLNELWGLGLQASELVEIGARVGADVPFCLTGGTAVARGKGEFIEQLPPLEGAWFVLVVPQIKVSTADVYRQFDVLLGDPGSLDDPGNPGEPGDPGESGNPGGPGDRGSSVCGAVAASASCGPAAAAAATAATYRPRGSNTAKAIEMARSRDIEGLAGALWNALEAVTARRNPEIARIKEMLVARGALGAVMSGSGPAVIGLVRSRESALRVREEISSRDISRDTGIAGTSVSGASGAGVRVFVCGAAPAGVMVKERECVGRGGEQAWWMR
ncbi:MAG: 4-(cytidine 5'-diphospho)-2-C-methyl-D-erythritol kinase [Firmicutes bacterium]|nr:4-(cytidine 5'-diphospho)-2-C-methyl-D-erythritol kinase [Bacillota bacterium]